LLNLSTVPFRYPLRVVLAWLAIPLLGAMLCPVVRGADKDKDKEKKEDKKEKIETWVEVRTEHFVVASDGGEKTARHVADQFELLARALQATMPNARLTRGIPIQILAARDGLSFAKIFPEFPSDKRRPQPTGQFVNGSDKTFIGIRTNVSGSMQYDDIYREYSQMVLNLSYRNLPPWLEIGYSSVYADLILSDREARLSRPDPDDMSTLFESPLLPLDLVLKVDRDSPYYAAAGKTTVYSAESRALVHFLLTDPQFAGTKDLEQFISRVEGGADPLASARQVFGDLTQLQASLEAYIKQTKSPPVQITMAGGSDSSGAAKTLSAAESEARMGAFEAARGRREDARDRLEEALRDEPPLAEAEQSLGFLSLQTNELEEADQHFTRAMALDPNDAMNFYGQGLVALSRGGHVGVPVGAVVAFEKTIALNPDFAPAWFNLATIYVLRDDTLQKALTDAQRAASLEPGESSYQRQVVAILDRQGQIADERKAVAAPQAPPSNSRESADTASSSRQIPQQQASSPSSAPSASTSGTPPAPSTSGASGRIGSTRIERKTEPGDSTPTATATAPRTEPVAPPPPIEPAETRVYSMMGTITDVVCSSSPQVQITLKSQMIVMKLHADNFAQLTFKSAASSASIKNIACASLRGRSAKVSYLLVSGKAWDGEMQIVEFRPVI
jgi:tetratricopeptide (TPR) repeat protein